MRSKKWLFILFISIATALMGELRIAPFGWEFRFGLGSSTFFFLLLLFRQVPIFYTSIVTGIIVVLFRTFTSSSFLEEPFNAIAIATVHLSAMFYYIAFGIGLTLVPRRLVHKQMFLFGFFVIMIDVFSNLIELLARFLLLEITPLLWTEWAALFIVTAIRVYFVLGIYASLIQQKQQAILKEQEKRYETLLGVSASLYGESYYLSKMVQTMENTTNKAFLLYRQLRPTSPALGGQALQISQDVHEIKKDAQRVQAGITRLHVHNRTFGQLTLSKVGRFALKSNETYSHYLNKQIHFHISIKVDYLTIRHVELLSCLNNLLANSVEAIDKKGQITLSIFEKNKTTFFEVMDDGNGIENEDFDYICEPGFTTKYNDEGTASTGIGLTHVQHIVFDLGGTLFFERGEKTKATLSFPSECLIQGVIT